LAGEAVDPVRFAVYGDQRALADGEWQDLVARIEERHGREPLHFVLDTGDIVQDGRHSDQFAMLTEILAPIRELPYLVAVGNHEVHNNRSAEARRHTARFLALTDPSISPERLYYSKQIGSVRLLFLDTNDLAYGPTAGLDSADAAAAQILWLDEQLASTQPEECVVVAMHHPLVQSSKKHREHAVALWNRPYDGRTLPERYLDAGVDLVLVGHTHTYERFRVQRGDRHFEQVNLSGRPRTSILWIGDGARRAQDIRGEEIPWLRERGWERLDGISIEQGAVMIDEERDQYAIVTVGPSAAIELEVVLVDGAAESILERVELR
jgi:3',5'-cyclic AMP phosphodiesterase CpdA